MQARPTAYLAKVAPTLAQTEWNNATRVSEGTIDATPGQQEGHRTSEATNSASPVLGSSVVANSDSNSSDIARRIVASDGDQESQALELSPAEKQLFDEVGPQAIAQQMLITAVQNSSPAIVQAIIDTYANQPDIQNGLITILQTYKIKVAKAWWSDYWIDHEPGKQTIYVSDGKWFQSRSTSSIVSELEEAIRDDAVFYKQFGLDESWSGMSQRIGFAFVDLGAGALAAAGGVALAVVPEPTLITKAGAGLAFAAAGNQFVAGGTALLGRESRVDLIHSALDSYYDATGLTDTDLRFWGHASLTASELFAGGAAGLAEAGAGALKVSTAIKNSTQFANKMMQASAQKMKELFQNGMSIRQIAKVDSIPELMTEAAERAKVVFTNGGCFVAGTQVHLSALPRTSSDSEPLYTWMDSEDGTLRSPEDWLVSTSQATLLPIEEVPLGSRVETRNPLGSLPEDVSRLETEDLAEIRLTIERSNGSIVDAELLRPLADVLDLRIGDMLPIHSEELEVDGVGVITSIRIFEGRSVGEGNLVTGRFKTREVSEILRVTLSNGEVIEGTKSHPVWSMNIAAFLRLDELEIGDVLDTLDGPHEVVAIDSVTCPQPVYNIEVASEHVYRIGQSGVLVHNVSDDCPLVQITVAAGKKVPVNPTVVKDSLGRIISSKAVIQPWNLYGGTSTTTAARAMTTPDDAGHIIGSLLGGKGGALSDNIFAQNSTINRGQFAKHEGWVANQVRAGKRVEVEIQLVYQGNATKPSVVKYITNVDGEEITKVFLN